MQCSIRGRLRSDALAFMAVIVGVVLFGTGFNETERAD